MPMLLGKLTKCVNVMESILAINKRGIDWTAMWREATMHSLQQKMVTRNKIDWPSYVGLNIDCRVTFVGM